MVELDIIEQKPISLAELKGRLDATKLSGKELNFRANKVYSYLEEFTSLDLPHYEEFYKKLSGLGIQKLRDRQIVKIIDLMPEDADSLKTIFIGESSTLKQDEIKQILDALHG